MTSDEIRRWRPTRFRDFVGTRNRRVIDRLRRRLVDRGRLPSPLLFAAPFGYGKTSLARLFLLGLNCPDRDGETGDPCLVCQQCVAFVPANNRTGFPFLRLEVDCTHARRPQIIRLCKEFRLDANAAIFLDELHRLHEHHSQEPLLKFLEDFPGILIAAVMADRYLELIPPLRERFETVCLEPPAAEEVVAFLAEKCSGEWQIRADDDVLRSMVESSGVSFQSLLEGPRCGRGPGPPPARSGTPRRPAGRPSQTPDDSRPDQDGAGPGKSEDDELFLE